MVAEHDWRESAGPWARVTLPDGQELDVIVTARERTPDGEWWFACEALLPDRYQDAQGQTRETAAPTAITVHADHIVPIPGERYDAVPTNGAVAGRQWVLVRVRMPVEDGPTWRVHRRDCWQISGETRRATTAEAVERYRSREAAPCDVCRPDRVLGRGR
ncbi:hypothetical protein DVA86_17530 [Streptomyces armeniacus]|uniref:Uncharacterized protein n=1 Tax=Streptomyces armeniacus TaxID=83291 RepID=A0A345XRC0_9ACTN|nr:DUF6233 domain-containing protein [Streptomyces armeniacus]AXK34186.1 hypothetical protein DVA86_17530 [Streptomyces armeniacus]